MHTCTYTYTYTHTCTHTYLPLLQGQTAQFVCVTSRPPPGVEITIDWFKDGEPLRNLRRIDVDEAEVGSLLTINDIRVTDNGTYSCVARTRIDEKSIDFSLTLSS